MFYNCHIHIFTEKDIPLGFLPLGMVRVLATKRGFRAMSRLLNGLNPFSDDDTFDRYIRFVKLGKLGSQENIFNECARYYPEDTKFIILPMDMAFMGAGKVPRDYNEQIKELGELKKKTDKVIPFIHIDPRRPGYFDLFRQAVEEYGFRGLKIYPPLGYFPYDEGLYPVYQYCQDHNLPVLTHCSPFNPVHFKGKEKDLLKLLEKSKTPVETKGKNRKELCANFTNPRNWEYVMQDFKNLRICLGHFGSAYYWEKYIDNPGDPENWFVMIKEMIPKYENLYADISFTLNQEGFFALLKVLMGDKKLNKKILFGSDYYMVETEATERRFGLDLRAFIGEEYFDDMAYKNAKVYLGE